MPFLFYILSLILFHAKFNLKTQQLEERINKEDFAFYTLVVTGFTPIPQICERDLIFDFPMHTNIFQCPPLRKLVPERLESCVLARIIA